MKKKVLAVLAATICLGCGGAAIAGCTGSGHAHVFEEQIVAPTCADSGYTQHNCTDCDYYYRDSFTEPTGVHVPVTDEAVAATCTTNGLTEGSHCEICNTVLIAQQTVDPTGVHVPVTDEAVDATCTTDGLTEGSHCKNCNTVFEAQKTINATGHKFRYTKWDDNTHSGGCAGCDIIITNESHIYIDGFCRECGYENTKSTDFEFERSQDGASYIVKKYISTSTDVVVPTTFNGLPVTEIGASAFSQSDVTSVIIPEGITKIGRAAFYNCPELESVSIPSSVTEVDDIAFNYCIKLNKNEYEGCYYLGNQLQPYLYLIDHSYSCSSLIIRSETKFIDDDVLWDSYSKEFVIASDNTTFTLVNDCLINLRTKTLVRGNENSVIPADGSVTTIGSHAFYVPFDEFDVTIPNAIETIKTLAFSTAKMQTLHIPASVKVIEQGAFRSDELEEITVDSANVNYYVKGNCLIEKATKILIRSCNDSVVPLNEGITEIGNYAFASSKITSVRLPDTVKKIGMLAFNACSELTEVDTGAGLTVLEYDAFSGCNSLQTLFLPSSLKEIKYGALSRLANLTVHFNGTSTMWENVTKEKNWCYRSNITVQCIDYNIEYTDNVE